MPTASESAVFAAIRATKISARVAGASIIREFEFELESRPRAAFV
jgi:hypothetical protein